jgi:TPP-dependent 2-oxoacid decarboxylase
MSVAHATCSVTAASVILNNPATAAEDIDRVLTTCVQSQKPVYIALPSDMVSKHCAAPTTALRVPPSFETDAAALKECVGTS